MAIKVNNVTVIDDSRNLKNLGTIEAAGSVGTAGSVLISTGTGIQWVAQGEYYSFATSGTFTKPSVGNYALVRIWGGGGSGCRTPGPVAAAGGGGGACVEKLYLLPNLPPSIPVTIGSGGAAVPGAVGNAGGNSTFGSLLTIYGGGAGANGEGGGGGGLFSSAKTPLSYRATGSQGGGAGLGNGDGLGTMPVRDYPTTYQVTTAGLYAGGSGAGPGGKDPDFLSGASFYGGGGGGAAGGQQAIASGSVYGGGGGSRSPAPATRPYSQYGGRGGTTGDLDGEVKGGGGAGVITPLGIALSGAGGPGFCEVYVW